MNDLISIIVPVFNGEKYLKETIECILDQTYKNFELIIIDDGSIDSTLKICEDFALKDRRILFFHQENKGVSAARNEGIRMASGRYICFVDGDDYIESDMIETLYKNSVEYDVDISCCGIMQETIDGYKNYSFCNGEKIYIEDKLILIEKFFSDPIYKEVLYGPVNKLFKAELIKSVLFNEKFKIGEDLLFSFECIEKINSFYFENRGLYHYIKRPGSATTSQFSKKRFDYIYVADILLDKCMKKYNNAIDSAIYWVFIHKLNMCRSLNKQLSLKRENTEFYKKCYEFCKENKKIVWSWLNLKNKIYYYILKFVPNLFKII